MSERRRNLFDPATASAGDTGEIALIDAGPLRRRLDRLQGQRDELASRQTHVDRELAEAQAFLSISDDVISALAQLSHDVFERDLQVIESTITKALQEVLEQPVVFKATGSFKNNASHVDFSIERNGHSQDILRGQGGSVANVVSVGLRMFAITMLNETNHRKFLVLDEQDCWLHPDLVPRLVKIVHEAGTALGFQVLMISHHEEANFVRNADRVYRLTPDRGQGVGIVLVQGDRESTLAEAD